MSNKIFDSSSGATFNLDLSLTDSSANTTNDITEAEFNKRVSQLIDDGNRLNYSMDHVSDELVLLVKTYPQHAKSAKLPDTFLEMRNTVVEPKRFKSKNITPQTDLAKTFEIKIIDDAERNGESFGAKMTITKGTGESITVTANSWSSTVKESGKKLTSGIIEGTFPAVYSKTGHKGGTLPGIRINNGNNIQTVDPNPKHGGGYWANGVNIHCGGTVKRGSASCNTIKKDECQKVWDFLEEGSTGLVTIERSKDAPDNFWENKK